MRYETRYKLSKIASWLALIIGLLVPASIWFKNAKLTVGLMLISVATFALWFYIYPDKHKILENAIR